MDMPKYGGEVVTWRMVAKVDGCEGGLTVHVAMTSVERTMSAQMDGYQYGGEVVTWWIVM